MHRAPPLDALVHGSIGLTGEPERYRNWKGQYSNLAELG